MERTLFTFACWLVLAPIVVQKGVAAAPSKALRPNILIIFADDKSYLFASDAGILQKTVKKWEFCAQLGLLAIH